MTLTKQLVRVLRWQVVAILLLTSFNTSQAQNKWAVVMSKYSKYSQQVWFHKSYFPRESIKKYWKMGYKITNVSYGERKWAVVMSRGSGYGQQSWATRTSFPREKINDYWHRGYNVTSVAYGNGLWAVVGTKNSGLTRQYWTTNASFPSSRISEYWRKGYAVTNMFYGQGKWAVMMSRSSSYGSQTWVKSTSFPAKRISQKWREGYSITGIGYGKGEWVVMFTKNMGYVQSWALRDYYPNKRIKTYWDKRYAITSLINGSGGISNNNSVVATIKPKPVIRWNTPSGLITSTRNSRYSIDVCIKSSSAVRGVKVYVNDRLQTTRGFSVVKSGGCAKTIKQAVSLSNGLNRIKVVATNAGGTVSSSRRVRYTARQTENTITKATINWITPNSAYASTTDKNYTINACIKSPSRVRSVKVYVNGVAEYTRGFEVVTADDCAKSLRKTVALQKGENKISVVVRNAAGTMTSRRTVNYQSPVANNNVAGKRVALIIGNADYANAPLRNPANDARAMAKSLRSLGFEVMEHINVNQETMETAITQFGNKIKNGSVGLFYFAGHGLQVQGENYLIPLKAKIDKEQQVKYKSVNLGLVLAEMDAASNPMNIVILDACRNNPFKASSRSNTRGLASTTAPTGTFIAYATAPGSVAADGEGANGLYTQELLKMLRVPGLTIEQVFKKVRAKVLQQTNGKQTPWENSSIIGDFYFKKR